MGQRLILERYLAGGQHVLCRAMRLTPGHRGDRIGLGNEHRLRTLIGNGHFGIVRMCQLFPKIGKEEPRIAEVDFPSPQEVLGEARNAPRFHHGSRNS